MSTSSRGGIAAFVAVALASVGGSTAEARHGAGRRDKNLACRSVLSGSTANKVCCSGRFRAKPGSGTDTGKCRETSNRVCSPSNGEHLHCLFNGQPCKVEWN